MLDIDGLKASANLVDIAQRYGLELNYRHGEYHCHCPFHDEKTESFSITEGKGFYCFGCGAKGNNAIEFTRLINNLPDDKHGFLESARILADMINHDLTADYTPPPPRPKLPEPEDIWQITPPAEPWQATENKTVTVYNPKSDKDYPITFAAAYPYHYPDGSLCGVILRTERNGKKQFQPITYRFNVNTGEARWVVLGMPEPRPLYGSELIAANPEAKILLVEGEKARHAAERLINNPKLIPVTWAGGSKAIDKTDWSPLVGRDVMAWPDNDVKTYPRGENKGELIPYHEQAGMSAMLKIAQVCGAANFKIVRVGEGMSDGWDLADAEAEGWDRARVIEFMKANAAMPSDILPPPEFEEPLPEPLDSDLYPAEEIHFDDYVDIVDEPVSTQITPFNDEYIKILGWDSGNAFYLPHGFKQVVQLPAGGHTRLQLMAIAPLRYWRESFPSEKRSGGDVDWELAADSLIQRAQKKGVFDADMLRGRGAWFDAGRSVVHAGDRLFVNGVETNLSGIDSKYIYQLMRPMSVTMAKSLTNSEAVKFVDICERIRWEDPINARLLAGWCFLAPICGAIDWRPHLWLTGPAGSGKSTVIYRIMKPALGGHGGMMIHAAGDTTEAGLRQVLRQDALPVLFDEFESEREKAANRVDDVLALVRQSSSDTGAEIIKGGSGGMADRYLIRSMFAFASISVGMSGKADESRITVLAMKGTNKEEQQSPEIQEQWIDLNKRIQETLTEDFIHGLQARAIRMIPTIRENIQAFSDAVARAPHLGGKRLGDQVGTLLAGAYSMFSEKPVTVEEALAWINMQDWSQISNAEAEGDESDLMMRIMSHQVRTEGRMITQNLTIAELVDIACKIDFGTDNVDASVADSTLQRYGIRCEIEDDMWRVLFANNHPEIDKIVRKSGYAGWYRILKRFDGAITTGTKRFAGVAARAVSLPLVVVRADD